MTHEINIFYCVYLEISVANNYVIGKVNTNPRLPDYPIRVETTETSGTG